MIETVKQVFMLACFLLLAADLVIIILFYKWWKGEKL